MNMIVPPKSERFEFRLNTETLDRIDEWRRAQPDLPSRSEAARGLIDIGLAGRREEKQLFQLTRFNLLTAAMAAGAVGASLTDAYVYAWDVGVYPLFDNGAHAHEPFAS